MKCPRHGVPTEPLPCPWPKCRRGHKGETLTLGRLSELDSSLLTSRLVESVPVQMKRYKRTQWLDAEARKEWWVWEPLDPPSSGAQ